MTSSVNHPNDLLMAIQQIREELQTANLMVIEHPSDHGALLRAVVKLCDVVEFMVKDH